MGGVASSVETEPATTECQLCGGRERQIVSRRDRHGNPLDTVLCLGCGIITNDPIPSEEELKEFYHKDYRRQYKGAAEPRKRQVWRNFGRTESHINRFRDVYAASTACLDLGAGSGEFMFLMRALGVDCVGIEPSEDYSAYCRDTLELDVRTQTLEETDLAGRKFDLIRLSHVLEHMPAPVRSLSTLREWLAEDGLLYVEVPNIGGDAERKLRGRLFHFGHIFNFNPFTLRLAASLAGLEECPQTEQRCADTTGAFFRRRRGGYELPMHAAQRNAVALNEMLKRHNVRAVPKPRESTAASLLVKTISTRLRELYVAQRYADARAIADYFADRLKRETA